jgi:hypothetical protein
MRLEDDLRDFVDRAKDRAAYCREVADLCPPGFNKVHFLRQAERWTYTLPTWNKTPHLWRSVALLFRRILVWCFDKLNQTFQRYGHVDQLPEVAK